MADEEPRHPRDPPDLAVYLEKHKGKGHAGHIHGGGKVIQQGVLPLEIIPAHRQSGKDPQKHIHPRGDKPQLQAVDQSIYKVGGGVKDIGVPLQRKPLGGKGDQGRGGKGGDNDDHQGGQQKDHHQPRQNPAGPVDPSVIHSFRLPSASYSPRSTAR